MDNKNNKGAILITGGAKRIGKELVLSFAKQGYDVAFTYLTSKKEAQELKKEVLKLGVQCEIFKADLTNVNEAKKMLIDVFDKFPDLNVLINNASVFEERKFEDIQEEYLDENFNIHFKIPFFLSQIFAEKCESGNIINITDSNTRKNVVLYFGYMLSKKSLNDLTKMTSRVLAPKIRVNAIAPGTILPSQEMTESQIKEEADKLPLKRIATPDDITKTIFQIIDNKSITGHIFYLDGGKHLL